MNDYEKVETIIEGIKKSVYIFGTGIEGERLFHILEQEGNIEISGFVDNNTCGSIVCEKKVITLAEYMKVKKNNILIIATLKNAIIITKQCKDMGLKAGKDYVVWDEEGVFRKDDITERYIAFNKKIWGPFKDTNHRRKNVVLIPYRNRADLIPAEMAFFGNYFAEKYEADIYSYMQNGLGRDTISPNLLRVYKSINVKDVICVELDSKLEDEVSRVFEDLKPRIKTWEEWKDISIYNIHFGTTIIRWYLRFRTISLSATAEENFEFLKKQIRDIVFWNNYFENNDVKVVVLTDAMGWEGIIRDLAVTKGITVYSFNGRRLRRVGLDYYYFSPFVHFKKFFNELSDEEKKKGIAWAKENLKEKLAGNEKSPIIENATNFVFSNKKSGDRVMLKNEKVKVMICPHILNEDVYQNGPHIFDDNYISWLVHLGELSKVTPQIDWYIKLHPHGGDRDYSLIQKLVEKYPKIKLIAQNVSPWQLKEEGLKYALTVGGTIGQEYPAMGITVINAGQNPYSSFRFTYNPLTKKEYDELIMNIDKIEPDKDLQVNELYEFICVQYLYYNWYVAHADVLFDASNEYELCECEYRVVGCDFGIHLYQFYMDSFSDTNFKAIWGKIPEIIKNVDEWRSDVFYRKEERLN